MELVSDLLLEANQVESIPDLVPLYLEQLVLCHLDPGLVRVLELVCVLDRDLELELALGLELALVNVLGKERDQRLQRHELEC